MKNEIKEILEALKPHDEEFTKAGIKEYPLVLSVKEQKTLLYHINNLQDTLKDREEYCYGLETQLTNLQEENEKLKNGYCELKVKCNNGECDCTNEEYENMVQANMRGSLLLEEYKSRIDKAIEYIRNHQLVFELSSKKQIQDWFDMFYKDLINILNSGDNNE